MIHIDSSKYQLDVGLYEDIIQKDGFDMHINMFEYMCAMKESEAIYATIDDLLKSLVIYISRGELQSITPDAISLLLSKFFNIEETGLAKRTSKGKISLDMKTVIAPLRDYAVKNLRNNPSYYSLIIEFCDLYKEYKQAKSYMESTRAKAGSGLLRRTELIDNTGNALWAVASHYERQSTGRYYTSDDNLQAWNKKIVDTFTAPKDYFFVWSDFDQIDFRVAANLVLFKGSSNDEDRELFNSIDDKYEAMARIIDRKLGRDFDIRRFTANRKAYKTSVLARLYGASKFTMAQSGFTDFQEINALDRYYLEHPYYQQYLKKFELAIAFGYEVDVEDYFGFVRQILLPQNSNVRSRVLEESLNTPIQSTANDIIMLWVNELTKEFQSLGFGLDKFRVNLIRHDEAIFLVHKDCIPYLYLFKKYSKIMIDDWTELTNQPVFGYKYTVENEQLKEAYEASVQANYGKLDDHANPNVTTSRNWIPCKQVARALFFYPEAISLFACQVLSYDRNYESEVYELSEMIEEKGRYDKEVVNSSKNLLRSYLDNAEEGQPYDARVLDLIKNYRKYFNYCVVEFIETGETFRVERRDFINFLKEHDVGYVYLLNSLIQSSFKTIDGIQIRYSNDYVYDTLVEKLEAYYDKR